MVLFSFQNAPLYIASIQWGQSLLFSHSAIANSFAAPWTIAHQAPLSLGFPRQEYWSGLPFPSPGILIQGSNLCLVHWQAGSLPLSHQAGPVQSVGQLLLPPLFEWALGDLSKVTQPGSCQARLECQVSVSQLRRILMTLMKGKAALRVVTYPIHCKKCYCKWTY